MYVGGERIVELHGRIIRGGVACFSGWIERGMMMMERMMRLPICRRNTPRRKRSS